MNETKITAFDIQPFFELEDYMNLCGESRLESAAMEEIFRYWQDWLPKLRARLLENGGSSWFAVWLPQDVEEIVDKMYDQYPTQGHLLNSLAIYMCMSAAGEIMPRIAESGCAPAPTKTPQLENALAQAGINGAQEGSRARYSVITYYPFRGGCEICDVRETCPKMRGDKAFASMILPGYERGAAK